jgi:hypothetical protein
MLRQIRDAISQSSASGKSHVLYGEMTTQTNQSIPGKSDKNASEISDLKDSVVVLHKHQDCYIMTSGLLSCQLSQCLLGKLLSLSGVGVYLTQIVGQQNTDDMIQNLNQVGGSELVCTIN